MLKNQKIKPAVQRAYWLWSGLSLWFQVAERGIEHPGNSFGRIFLLFPMKVTRGHAHNPRLMALHDSPVKLVAIVLRAWGVGGRGRRRYYPSKQLWC